MSRYRPYWARHPLQRRVVAVLLLPLTPLLWALWHLWTDRKELAAALTAGWEAVVDGDEA